MASKKRGESIAEARPDHHGRRDPALADLGQGLLALQAHDLQSLLGLQVLDVELGELAAILIYNGQLHAGRPFAHSGVDRPEQQGKQQGKPEDPEHIALVGRQDPQVFQC